MTASAHYNIRSSEIIQPNSYDEVKVVKGYNSPLVTLARSWLTCHDRSWMRERKGKKGDSRVRPSIPSHPPSSSGSKVHGSDKIRTDLTGLPSPDLGFFIDVGVRSPNCHNI